MTDPFFLVPGIIVVGVILLILLKNEYEIRNIYKDGEIKKPFVHPPNKHKG